MTDSTASRGEGLPAATAERPSAEDERESYRQWPWNVNPIGPEPELRCKRYLDGLASIPVDLLRDPNLGHADKVVALALSSVALGDAAEVEDRTTAIGKACGGLSRRAVQSAVCRLRAAGWVELVRNNKRVQRKIVLLWKLPDDCSDMVPAFQRGTQRRRRPLPLFPDGDGGEP